MFQNILLIQDDPANAKTIREALVYSGDGAFQVEWLRTCAAALERLAWEEKQNRSMADCIVAVLVDLSLSDSQGIETFDRLFLVAPQIPILVFASLEDEDSAKLAVQHGAQDYLLKSRLDNYLLPKTLRSMIERSANADALFAEKERALVTLNSIGDAVLCTDVWGDITYLNTVAEKLTGWSCAEATGQPLEKVFHIIDAVTRDAAPNPVTLAIRENRTVSLTPNCLLLQRHGKEASIEDSTAPIHDRRGYIAGAVIVFRDDSAERILALRMSYLAQHDSLTDLPNRSLLSDRLGQALARAQRNRQKLAVLFLDMDRFKHINDSLGHDIGDRLLRAMAQRLLASVRSSDTVSRQGGDEFVVLLSEVTQAQDAAVTAEKIILALRKPYRIDQHDLHITVSIGIVTYPDDGVDAETLLRNADFAMYQAKDGGRDNYQFFKSEMNVSAIERQSLENDLRRAVERQEFVLLYEPKVNLASGAIIGVEALLRWRHPQRGLLLAGQFIPIAEESGLIVSIGRWVLRAACLQARAWQDAGAPPLRIAINISAVELRAKEFVAGVQAVLTETGLQPHYLELELKETFLMQDSDSTATVLRALKAMGVQLALDDFGTGYSSLSYLKRFPIDTLKIDQSFVCNLTTDADDASIVSAVISMGNSLHMRVVAEGIETAEQLAALRERNCPEGQGYHFSLPVSAADITQLLTRDTKQTAFAGDASNSRLRRTSIGHL